jgi:hypothetical protein
VLPAHEPDAGGTRRRAGGRRRSSSARVLAACVYLEQTSWRSGSILGRRLSTQDATVFITFAE